MSSNKYEAEQISDPNTIWSESDFDKCKCGTFLFSRHELEDKRCNRCTDKLIQHSNERREWNYYHS